MKQLTLNINNGAIYFVSLKLNLIGFERTFGGKDGRKGSGIVFNTITIMITTSANIGLPSDIINMGVYR